MTIPKIKVLKHDIRRENLNIDNSEQKKPGKGQTWKGTSEKGQF